MMKLNQKLLLLNVFAVFVMLAPSACTSMSLLDTDDIDIDAYYKVNSDNLSLTFSSGSPDELDEIAWDKVVHLLPNDILKQQVVEYQVFSDGVDNTLAFVALDEADESKWAFALDYEDAVNPDSAEFAETVVHEFAHILALETTQVQREYDSCAYLEVEEGCAVKQAYINAFVTQFWQGADYQQHQKVVADLNEEDKQAVVETFYNEQPNSFVTEYAATDPIEDFAESFAFFVLSDKMDMKMQDNPTSIKDKKLAFFDDYPALVAIRQQIRNNTPVRK